MSDLKEITVNLPEGSNELTILKGDAPPVVPFRKALCVTGNLDTPQNYLKNAPKWFTVEDEIVLQNSRLLVNRDEGRLALFVDDGMPWMDSYIGMLQLNELFLQFKINTGSSFTTFELADLIKMNRSFFESNDKAMQLVSVLRNFKAKVDKDLENTDDNRGNKKVLVAQIVESNIPEAFNLEIPIFKGYPKQNFSIEININANDFSCVLISPEANDYINTHKNDLIDEQLEAINKLFPTLKVFEV